MAKRSTTFKYDSKRVKPKTVSVEVKSPEIEKMKKLKLLYQVKYKYHSEFSDAVYVWNGAGTVQTVDIRDATVLLAKVRKAGCCAGGTSTQHLFEEV